MTGHGGKRSLGWPGFLLLGNKTIIHNVFCKPQLVLEDMPQPPNLKGCLGPYNVARVPGRSALGDLSRAQGSNCAQAKEAVRIPCLRVKVIGWGTWHDPSPLLSLHGTPPPVKKKGIKHTM